MDINDYRRRIEASIAKEQARPSRSKKKIAAKSRTAAVAAVTREERPGDVAKTALARLADPNETAKLRIEAIKLLQLQQFMTPAASEWRPAYIAALRAALEDKAVRQAALEVLSLLKDRPTQERLLDGLRQPRRALVPVDQALRLLSNDVHADVIDAARKLIAKPEVRKNKAVSIQATRILAGDPQSVSTLERVLGSGAYSTETRRVAATALSHLAPERLDSYGGASVAPFAVKRAAAKKKGGSGAKSTAARKPTAAVQGALAKHIATLQRVRR